MTIERPNLRADQMRVGDRLLVAEDLDLTVPLPALPLVEGVEVKGDVVVLRAAGREVCLPSDANVVVERDGPDGTGRAGAPPAPRRE